MKKQVKYTRWYKVPTDLGVEWVEFDLVNAGFNPTFNEVKIHLNGQELRGEISVFDGYGARVLQECGNCATFWDVYPTEQEAFDSLTEK